MINTYNKALEYLNKKNLQKHINTLAKKYKNKKILIYGAGMFFDVISENFDISKLNIVAISDIKFNEETIYKGIKIVSPDKIKDLNFDAIIISNFAVRKIKNSVKSQIVPLCGKFKIEYFNKYTVKEFIYGVFEALNEKYESKSAKQSKLAHKYLDGLTGIEIGGSAHNSFGLKTLNVDYTDELTNFKKAEVDLVGYSMKVDVVSQGDDLPFKDNEWDFVISSHVFEHFWDPIKALKEWLRVIKPGGYVFMIVPHKERTFDRSRKRTTLQELINRHTGDLIDPKTYGHHSVWITEDALELCKYLNLNVVEYQDVDDKVGNGFIIIIKKD